MPYGESRALAKPMRTPEAVPSQMGDSGIRSETRAVATLEKNSGPEFTTEPHQIVKSRPRKHLQQDRKVAICSAGA
jgi:hypothetical protein